MKRHGRVLAVLTALILTANLAFTCYAQENSDGSSETVSYTHLTLPTTERV